MAKITIVPALQSSDELEPQNFTQVGGIYGGAEIKPEDFLVQADISEYPFAYPVEAREPRFFRVR